MKPLRPAMTRNIGVRLRKSLRPFTFLEPLSIREFVQAYGRTIVSGRGRLDLAKRISKKSNKYLNEEQPRNLWLIRLQRLNEILLR